MTDERDVDGNLLPDERRLTRFGQFLRAASLDELPELFNVVKGEMSIVGPRPLLMQYLDRYTSEQARRHEVKPGLTGWAQINGRNDISWEDKFRMDVWYVDHQAFLSDLKIIGVTILKVLKREGISQKGQATAQEFFSSNGRLDTEKEKEEGEEGDRFSGWQYPVIEEGRPTKYNWVVQHKENFKLGYKTDIGAFTYINARNGVTMEDYVQLGSHCSVYSVSTIDEKSGPVMLKRNCRIGSHSTIMPGVTIGENAVVGAHSFVNQDVPAGAVFAGVPAKALEAVTRDRQ